MSSGALTNPTFIVAVTGGSGSGKTTFARRLAASLAARRPQVLPEDDYYQDFAARAEFEPRGFNFDEPAAKDHGLLAAHLAALARGETVAVPRYDFKRHGRDGATTVTPSPVIIVEGITLLADPRVRSTIGYAIFLDLPAAERLARKVRRDVAERGRTEAFAREQFEQIVDPMHRLHVEPTRRFADDIVRLSGGDTDDAVLEAAIRRVSDRLSNISVYPGMDKVPGSGLFSRP